MIPIYDNTGVLGIVMDWSNVVCPHFQKSDSTFLCTINKERPVYYEGFFTPSNFNSYEIGLKRCKMKFQYGKVP